MSKDEETDEHGIDWLCGCHLVEFWLGSWANHSPYVKSIFDKKIGKYL
jgi:hypothetical protein